MPDRYVLTLRTAVASNTGGPYTATWDRAVVPASGTLRSARAVATSITSNARQNTVDIYNQASADPTGVAAASNTATSILARPITLPYSGVAVAGTISEAGVRVDAGDILELRTDAASIAAQPSFANLVATVEIERD